MRTAYVISGVGHAIVLLWSVWSFAGKPLDVPPNQALPIDIVTDTEFSQITAGAENAPQVEKPKPLVEKVAEKKLVEDPKAKVVEKKEVTAAREAAAPPPEPAPAEPKPQEKKKAEPQKPDQIAEALQKDEAKKPETKPEPKKVEAKPPVPPRKPAPPQPKFDANQVAALLNKREPTRLAAAGDTLNNTASLGLPSGTAAQISQSELDALRARLAQLWNPPAGAQTPDELVVLVRVKFKPDGTLAGPPTVLTSGKSQLFLAARDSAVRALFRGQPFNMLKPEHYEQWKEIEINFDPRYMIRG